jgi:hypothetical protein
LLAFAAAANAAIVGVALGSGPRSSPMTLGPYTNVTLLPADPSGVFSSVTSVPGVPPLTGPVGFSAALSHRKIGSGWMTWSQPWTPGWDTSVYYQSTSSVTINLPAGTAAFAFWAEPNAFVLAQIKATAQDGTVVTQTPHGSSGAMGYGFYGTGGSLITSITVVADASASGFAIGEFYGIPEPTSLSLLALGGLALLRRR